MTNLLERIRKATGPSRDIDIDIFKIFHPEYISDDWQLFGDGLKHKDSNDPSVKVPYYTSSVDAVLNLIETLSLNKSDWEFGYLNSQCWARVYVEDDIRNPILCTGKTLHLAILNAILQN